MKDTFWFYSKFAALFWVISLMVVFNWLTTGFHRTSRRPIWHIEDARPEQGPALIKAYGCGACHTLPKQTENARTVGPSLERVADRNYLAGTLANTPSNMIRWIQNPQQIRPSTAMPNLGVSEEDARDITAYLVDPSAASSYSLP